MDYTQLTNILFLDIETVSEKASLEQIDQRFQALWEKKAGTLKPEISPSELYREKAAIYAEFGRIVVIGTGHFTLKNKELSFRTRSFSQSDERVLLQDFTSYLAKLTKKEPWKLCAHNGKEFDFPYLCRRLLVHDQPLPKLLQIMGKKPWETHQLLDTMELWKFGDIKAYTSLELMAASLGIPTSKNDIDGSQVGKVYYETGDVKRIATYCQKDVAVMAQVYMRMMGLGNLKPVQILIQA
jgi:uncharacterized protein YprB with RNaseH-like and TPR domain